MTLKSRYRTYKPKDDEFDQNENSCYKFDDWNHNQPNSYSNIKEETEANRVPIHSQDSSYVN